MITNKLFKIPGCKFFAWMRRWLVLLAPMLILFRANGQGLSEDQLRNYIEDARLSIAVYHLDWKDSKTGLGGGWTRMPHPISDSGGFQAAAYERTLPNGQREIKVAIAGTRFDNPENILTDLRQGAPWNMGTYDKITEQQYAQAVAYVNGYLQLQKNDKS